MYISQALASAFSPLNLQHERHRFVSAQNAQHVHPGLDRSISIDKTETGFQLRVDAPGLSKEHLHIEVEDDCVRISSQSGAPRRLKLAYRLPTQLDGQASSAKVENGVIELHLVTLAPVGKARVLPIS